MRKVRNKKFCLVMALVFALSVMFPFSAFAADYQRMGSVNVVSDGENEKLNAVKVTTSGGELTDTDMVMVRLPKDFELLNGNDKVESDWKFGKTVSGDVYYGDYNKGCYIFVPKDEDNGLSTAGGADVDNIFNIKKLGVNEISITVNGTPSVTKDGQFFIYLNNVKIDDGFDGDIELVMDAPSGSGFDDNKVIVGRASGSGGELEIEVTDTDSFDNEGDVTIRVTENLKGAFEVNKESLKFTLPSGFEWKSGPNVKLIYGDLNLAKTTVKSEDDELIIGVEAASTEVSCIEIEAKIEVADETKAKFGEITANIKGKSDFIPNEIIVGTYGEIDVSVSAADPTTVYAGKLEQEIADISIKEALKDSLTEGRTITLTLPAWAKWGSLPFSDKDKSAELTLNKFPGKDGQVATYKVTQGKSSSAATIELEDLEVVLSPKAPAGDLVVEVAGTQGVNGEIVVAKVKASVEASVADAPTIVIGKAKQAIGEITITETGAEALIEDKDLVLELPTDVVWDSYEVEVVEGDLELGDIDDDDELLTIEIDGESTVASTIKVTGTVTGYRTIPEGDVTLKVKGSAVGEVNDVADDGAVADYYGAKSGNYWTIEGIPAIEYDKDGLFEDDKTVAKVVVASVGTPAPSDQKLTTTIALGDNGSYISDGRIMVQLRDAANSLGVAPQNIFWDNTAKAATFIKGERVVQLIVGDPQVKLNGVSLPTDKGAEIKDGRTFVSLSAAGIALGATASWDNTAKVATLTIE